LDNLDRSIIITKIELESLRNENDSASVERRRKLEEKLAVDEAKSRELNAVWSLERQMLQRRKDLQKQLDDLRTQFENATRVGDFNTASRIKYQEIPAIEKQLREAGGGGGGGAGEAGTKNFGGKKQQQQETTEIVGEEVVDYPASET
jgi:ATP-dependent Clp protease ATP-binding subunit ClpB